MCRAGQGSVLYTEGGYGQDPVQRRGLGSRPGPCTHTPPCKQNDRQARLKTLPLPASLAGGKYSGGVIYALSQLVLIS